ncbi:MAG: hypothetical protein H7246_19775 [Phycisphaerae bacterium]|nr:hypothetical protein [Saprospiraceae bacterium]
MKTSYVLLATVAAVTLTGLVATDVLLKQQYDKIDWSDRYRTFERRALPSARHLVIEAAPVAEIIVEKNARPHALVDAAYVGFYRTRQRGDTLFVTLTPDFDGRNDPKNNASAELRTGLVLRLPGLQSLRVRNGRLTIRDFTLNQLAVSLRGSRLRTNQLTVRDSFTLTESGNSFAVLGADRYQSLRVAVRDSSGLQLDNAEAGSFTAEVSPKAEVQLRGRALRWLAK